MAPRSARKDGCEFAKWVTWPNSLLAHRLQMFAESVGKGDQVYTSRHGLFTTHLMSGSTFVRSTSSEDC